MSNLSDAARSKRDVTFTAVIALCVTAIGCAVVMMSVPRPARLELPTLQLDADQVDAQLAQESVVAARPMNERMRAVYQQLLQAGRDELDDKLGGDPDSLTAQQALRARYLQLTGQERATLYAYAADRFLAALADDVGDALEARGLLGKQLSLLATHGYITEDGAPLAPRITLRATYKVRLNMLLGEPLFAQLTQLEQQAYQGFRALEARNLPDSIREDSLLNFQRLHGAHVDEALLIWSTMNNRPEPLVELMRRSPAATKRLRLRNMAVTAAYELERQENE